MKKMLWIFLVLTLFLFTCNSSTSPEEEDILAPEIPGGLAVDTDNSFDDAYTLTWTANTESDLNGYYIYLAAGQSDAAYRKVGEVGMNDETFSGDGLDYDTTYYFKISAFDKSGNESDKSTAVEHTPLNIDKPSAPANTKAYGYNYGDTPYIDIQWDENTSDSDFDHYEIYKNTSAQFSVDSDYFLLDTTATSYEDYDVEVGVKYYYRIICVDKGDKASENSSIDYVTDLALPVTELVSPANNSDTDSNRPEFTWNAVENATKYVIYVQASQQSDVVWEQEVQQPTGEEAVSVTISSGTLSSNQTYWWKVAAYSSDNTAANSYSTTWKFDTP